MCFRRAVFVRERIALPIGEIVRVYTQCIVHRGRTGGVLCFQVLA